jgi:hypothetical protein
MRAEATPVTATPSAVSTAVAMSTFAFLLNMGSPCVGGVIADYHLVVACNNHRLAR